MSACSATAASSMSISPARPTSFGAAAATPIEMLNQRWSAVYTTPQTYKNQLAFLNSTGSYQATDTLSFKGNIYYRGFWQKHVDGNTSDVVPCDPGLFPGIPVLRGERRSAVRPQRAAGARYPQRRDAGLDRPDRDRGEQLRRLRCRRPARRKLFGLNNQFVVGASVDRGRVNFKASSELGTIGPDLFVTGTGVIINQPDGSVAPANLKTSNTYYGFYLTDTIDLTSRLSVTAGGRFNLAQIKLEDQLGIATQRRATSSAASIRSSARPTRSRRSSAPMRAIPRPTARRRRPSSPAPIRSGPACSTISWSPIRRSSRWSPAPTRPGLRGNIDARSEDRAASPGTWARSTPTPRTTSSMSRAPSPGAASSRMPARRCAGASRPRPRTDPIAGTSMPATTIIDATFQDMFTLQSPGNPFAVDGLITVTPGNVMPSIPAHRVKAGVEYAVFDNWKVGADFIAVSGQYLRGDENNLNPMLPGYCGASTSTPPTRSRSRWKCSGWCRTCSISATTRSARSSRPTRFRSSACTIRARIGPGAPLAAYAGVRAKVLSHGHQFTARPPSRRPTAPRAGPA